VIAIDTSATGLTVRMTEEDTHFKVTPIVVRAHALYWFASPCLPAELLIVATPALLDVQCPGCWSHLRRIVGVRFRLR